ncbi:lipoprotein N-acyltransferase Lnb domain-containing protein [Yeosuana marina]|uniref:lipoprotein N-acyltransferase Lnb domain-containing protein n=1 Tax=Yeosuana marina TaxID=1565536 RepID=UPI0014235DC8|nr:DUF4105 domain-containing protein [Yeosuana marina]
MKKYLIVVLCLLAVVSLKAQPTLSRHAEISVLTIGPGSSLNDAFGHNAFRIKDSLNHIDVVFNYGIYDFNTPNFYIKFAQGRLNYLIGMNYYKDFYGNYKEENRTIKEQVLNLSQNEKQRLLNFLANNIKPENRRYLYDFFYDNCATKIRDVLETITDNKIQFNTPDGFKEQTFRQLIYSNLNKNSWGSFGIDLALGSVIDKKATPYEHMFLPKYIFKFFENATLSSSGEKLVKQTHILYQKTDTPETNNFLTSPLMIFGIIGLLILFITFKDYKNKKRSNWLDVVLFFATGIIGILILLLWFATDHKGTHQNYNLLWACALNILVVFQFFKKSIPSWFIRYLKFLIILLCLMLLHWIIGIQVFAIGLIPLLIALFIRYVYLINFFSSNKATDL